MPEIDAAPANEVDVADVTRPDPLDTVDVRLVSGTVAVPSSQDPAGGARIKSDLHCPLLVDDEDKSTATVVEQHVGQDGQPTGRTVHRVPEQVVVDPVDCPSCGKIVERHMLVYSPLTGERDCAVAINARANPKYTAMFGGDAKNWAEADADAKARGDLNKQRVIKVLGPRAADAPPPEASAATRRQPKDAQLVPGENLTDEAKRELDAQARRADPLTGGGFPNGYTDRKSYELATLRSAQGKPQS